MKLEVKEGARDAVLQVEAYRLKGIAWSFPNHFHDYYVIGLMEDGERLFSCRRQEYILRRGNLLLLNPGDNHACIQQGGTLDYRSLNIPQEVMRDWAGELTGRRTLPRFSRNVVRSAEAAACLRPFHEEVMQGAGRRERLGELLSLLLRDCGQIEDEDCGAEVERACAFMERHFSERLSLEQICRRAGLSKSALLRAFTKAKGVTPYSYLENVRICEARKLLEQGMTPGETALRTGFSDQSHFTHSFSRLIGLGPGAYRGIFLEKEGMDRHGA